MTVIKVNTKYVPSLPELTRMVLEWIYEPKTTITDEYIYRSYMAWANKIYMTEVEEYILVRIGKMIDRHGRGGFERRKKLFREHGIDWRRFHKLPEAQLSRKEWVKALIKNTENDAKVVARIS